MSTLLLKLTNIPVRIKKTLRTYHQYDINTLIGKHNKSVYIMKKRYYEVIGKHFFGAPRIIEPVKLVFIFYAKDRNKRDLSNMCAITDKFITDLMVKLNILKDDDVTKVTGVEYVYGGLSTTKESHITLLVFKAEENQYTQFLGETKQ